MYKQLVCKVVATVFAITTLVTALDAQPGVELESARLKKAEKAFESKDYEKSLALYSQIVSNHPENPKYNYCLGVSMLKAGSDKAGAVRFLRVAVQSTQVPINSWMYQGMALHYAARYEEAIASFEVFHHSADKQWTELEGDKWLEMSRNALASTATPASDTEHRVMDTYSVPRNDFYTKYAVLPESGRFLVMPKEYEKFIIKGKPESNLVFLGTGGRVMLFTGKGLQGNDFDIFIVRKGNDNLWSQPEELTAINTNEDDAFPVISPDGDFIYFSSKGHGSGGGYDIFRSSYVPALGSWSTPASMGSQVNSPSDDFNYVPSADRQEAFYSSDRESAPGKCQVFRTQIRNQAEGVLHVQGTFVCPSALDNSEARITILRQSDRSLVQELRQQASFSSFTMDVQSATKYVYHMELAGFTTNEQEVDLTAFQSGTLIQEIQVKRENVGNETVLITQRLAEQVQMANQGTAKVTSSTSQQMALATTSSVQDISPATKPAEKATEKETAGIVEQPAKTTTPSTEISATPQTDAPILASITTTTPIQVPAATTPEPKDNQKQATKPDGEVNKTKPAVKSKVNANAKKSVTLTSSEAKPASKVDNKATSAAPQENDAFGDVIFKVQVGAYKDKTPAQLKKKFSTLGLKELVCMKNDQGIWVVMIGSAKDYNAAVALKKETIAKGVPDAFIVAYSNGKRLPLNLAVLDESQDE